jgi:branched-chain amino acid transport system permease protein
MSVTPAARPRSPAVGYWIGFAVVVGLLIIAPLVLPPFWQRFATEILIWGLLAMSSDILIGYTGMVSFGYSAFFGLGMYGAAAALLTTHPASLWAALLYGLIAAGVAAFVAYFATRLREIYFSISTLVFSQIFYVIIFTWTEVTGGENGLTFGQPRLSLLGLWSDRFTPTTFHWFVLTVVVISYLLVRRITQSPFGKVLQSIRENEPRTRRSAIATAHKIVAVMLSGFAGLSRVSRHPEQVRRAGLRLLRRLRRGRDLQRDGGDGNPGGTVRRRRVLPAAARGALAFPDRVLPDSSRHHLHRHDHLPAAGPTRLPPPPAERVADR